MSNSSASLASLIAVAGTRIQVHHIEQQQWVMRKIAIIEEGTAAAAASTTINTTIKTTAATATATATTES